ncbi:MAG TPA: two-component regulator propeller domain-containing protein [Candidatus Kapabacteria bacterium]|nr:two-component regulator propeller domain-containing protein [Candidatus Kapabacteria bacterium]
MIGTYSRRLACARRTATLAATAAVLLSIASTAACRAQPLQTGFQHIGLEQGLSQSFVYAIHQDSRGFFWFGTRDGLNRFDGYSFLRYTYQPFAPTTIASGVVRSICEDSHGDLWLGTYRGGLVHLERSTGRFTSFMHDPADPASIGSNDVIAFMDHTGSIWTVSADGLLDRFDAARWHHGMKAEFHHYRHRDADTTSLLGIPYSAYEDRQNNIWIGTDRGLNLLDRSAGTFAHIRSTDGVSGVFPGGPIQSLADDGMGNLWVATRDGLCCLDIATHRMRHITHHGLVQRITIDHHGVIWYGAYGGLYTYNPRNGSLGCFKHVTNGGPISGDLILSLFTDTTGTVWIGTDGGIDRTEENASRFATGLVGFDHNDSIALNNTRSLCVDRAGRIWIGTAGLGLISVDRTSGSIRHYLEQPRTSGDYINTIYQDHRGTLWFGSQWTVGYATMRGDSVLGFTRLNLPISIARDIWAICEDHLGMMWLGSRAHVFRLDRSTGVITLFRHDPHDPRSISYDGAWAIHEDRWGDLWFATPGGVNRFDRSTQTFVHYRYDPANTASLSHDEAWSLFEDHTGTLWVGTWGGGLNRFDRTTGRFTHYMEANGIASNVIHGILEDESGYLWVSTGRGISRFDPRTEIFTNYGPYDGIQHEEFNPNACCKTPDGMMIFGGGGGINSFRPDHLTAVNNVTRPIVVTSFRKLDSLFATELTDGAYVEVLPGENNFSFEFSSLDFNNPLRVRYSYMLEGFDDDWNASGTRRYVSYTNLDAGDYVFRVRATAGNGIWQPGIAVHVSVIPPFWRRRPFIVAAAVAVVLGAGFWYRRRNRIMDARENALANARETERRGIAGELHDGPLQDLYSVRFALERLTALGLPAPAREDLESIDDTLKGVRSTLRNVRGDLQLPSPTIGLDDAIRAHAERFRDAHPEVEVSTDLAADDAVLTEEMRGTFFRIYRTAMNNIAKHAGATAVALRLTFDARRAILEIRDNGRGFTPPGNLDELLSRKHYGLLLADSHARAIGARLEVTSAPDNGTTVRVTIERSRRLVPEWLRRVGFARRRDRG